MIASLTQRKHLEVTVYFSNLPQLFTTTQERGWVGGTLKGNLALGVQPRSSNHDPV